MTTPEQAISQEFSAYYNADEFVLSPDDTDGIERQATASAEDLRRMVGPEQREALAELLDSARHDPNDPIITLIRQETNLDWDGDLWPLLQTLLERIAAHLRAT